MLIVGVLALIAFVVVGYKTSKSEDNNWADVAFYGVMAACVAAMVGVCVAIVLGLVVPTQKTEVDRTTIVSLTNKSSIQGSFFLGIGSIDSTEYVFYFYEDEEGMTMRGRTRFDSTVKIDARNPVVEEPYMITYREEPASDLLKMMAFNLNSLTYVFVVPAGTVKTNYSIE